MSLRASQSPNRNGARHYYRECACLQLYFWWQNVPAFWDLYRRRSGKITINDFNKTDDAIFGDDIHKGFANAPDQDVTSSMVTGNNVGDAVDLRYKYTITAPTGPSCTLYFIASNGAANYGLLFVSDIQRDPDVSYRFGTINTDGAASYSSLVPWFARGVQLSTPTGG